MQRYWFKAKRYGWGWTPATWEGWLVTVAFIVLFIGVAVSADNASYTASDMLLKVFLPEAMLVLALLSICYATGEKPRWRWGGKD